MNLRKLAAAATTASVLALGPALGAAAADTNEWTSFSGITPGASIGQRAPDKNGTYRCTLAFIAREKSTYAKKAITAGHCDHSADALPTVFYTESSDPDTARPLGTFSRSTDRGQNTGTSSAGLPPYTDAGIIDMNPGIPHTSYKVAGVYRVTRTLRPNPPLAPGIEVCKYGARTGETCGPVISADNDRITVRLHLIEGDSGAPAYIKTGDNTITAVGMLSGYLAEDQGTAVIYYLFPVIDSLGLQICGDC